MGEHQELALVDVPAWQPQMSELPGGGRVSSMAFSPDSSQLALVYHQPDRDQLLRFDALNGATLASRELPFAVEGMVFVLGGSGLAAFGSSPGELVGISQPGAAQLLLLDFATLEPAWQHALAGVLSGQWCLENCEGSLDEIRFAYFKPAIALSPYRNQLFAVPAGEEIITHLDLKSRTIPIRPQQSWLE